MQTVNHSMYFLTLIFKSEKNISISYKAILKPVLCLLCSHFNDWFLIKVMELLKHEGGKPKSNSGTQVQSQPFHYSSEGIAVLELPSNGGSSHSQPKPMPHNTYCHACKCMPIYTSMTNSSQAINRGIKSEQKSLETSMML